MSADGDRLLIYAPVPLHRKDGALYLEDQACNGLRLWAQNFSHLTVMMPISDAPPPPSWVPIERVGPSLSWIRIEPLPMAYRPDQFLRCYGQTRRRIKQLISEADYMSFAIGGLFGDWGAVGSLQAHKMGRPFAVWTDRVESEVTRRAASSGHWRRRLRSRLYHRPMAWLERHLIRRATMGLFHGHETYETYAPYSRNPQLVHDIHLSQAEHMGESALRAKIAGAGQGPLRIVYAGRADPMKGPLDWVAVLAGLDKAGVDFTARWIGDGSEMAAMQDQIQRNGLSARVETPGFSTNRQQVLEELRQADIFLFCHKTPESPRCLIEALISATPIVGYSGAFARDLISEHGGGLLSPLDDVQALTDGVLSLAADPQKLGDLFARAAADGAPFDDDSVFRHRSDLIKRYL